MKARVKDVLIIIPLWPDVAKRLREVAVVVLVGLLSTSLVIIQVYNTVTAATTGGRHCEDQTNCIVGKQVELSNEKWKCIEKALEIGFKHASPNPNLTANVTEIAIALCLKTA